MASISKKEVRTHFETKFKERVGSLQANVKAISDKKCDEVLDELVKYGQVERLASNIVEELDKLRIKHKSELNDYDYINTISNLNCHVIGVGRTIKSTIKRRVYNHILEPHKQILQCSLQDVLSICNDIAKECRQIIFQIAEVNKLKEEILAIIDGSVSGNRAIKTLEELSVDISDIKYSSPNLPAVIKLSGDVSLINKVVSV